MAGAAEVGQRVFPSVDAVLSEPISGLPGVADASISGLNSQYLSKEGWKTQVVASSRDLEPFLAFGQNGRLAKALGRSDELRSKQRSASEMRLTIDQLLQLAVSGHPIVQARHADVQAAESNVEYSRWQYFPTPSVQTRHLDRGGEATVVAVQQPIWAGGRLDEAFEASQSRARSAFGSLAEAQYELGLDLVSAWQSWLAASHKTEVYERGLALLSTYSESVKVRIGGGISPESDRRLVDSRISQARGDLVAAKAKERSALSQLSQLVGRSLMREDLYAHWSDEKWLPDFQAVVSKAYSYAPILKRYTADAEAAQHEKRQKESTYMPTISMRAEYQHNRVAELGNDSTRYMLVLDYAPGAGLSSVAEVEAARSRISSILSSKEAARRELLVRVSSDFEEYRASCQRVEDGHQLVDASGSVLASYDRLFLAGKRSWLDVLNAVREFIQAEASLMDVRALSEGAYQRLRLHAGDFAWQQGTPYELR